MKIRTVILTLVSPLVLTSLAKAQFDPPPKISVLGAERVTRVNVGTESDFDLVEETNESGGPFLEAVSTGVSGDLGSFGVATSLQRTQISSFSVRGNGTVDVAGVLGGHEDATVGAKSLSDMTVVFTVPINAPYTLSASLEAEGEDEVCLSHASISFAGIDANGTPFNFVRGFDCNSPPEDTEFFASGTVLAGTPLGLSVQAGADVIAPGEPSDPGQLGSGSASIEFHLDFGDRDGDGLLDDWEENGIDFTGPGIEIDLPGMGADPDHKDIFVELDAMAGTFGVPADQAITKVFNAFASAPAYLVENPDGTAGINLWVLIDEESLDNQILSGTLEQVYAQTQAIKADHFGTEADRAHDSAEEILAAKKEIFRYCLWADDLEIVPENYTGFGERPGNDFVVAGGGGLEFFESQGYPASLMDEVLAGTFMHELGHTLNLQHGGQDEIHYKPHYQSVMNYGYVVPLIKSTIEGTLLAPLWHLDFSAGLQGNLFDLDEPFLDEQRGIWAKRPIFFNSAAETDDPPVQLALSAQGPIDWNGNGELDGIPVTRDITRWFEAIPFELQYDLRTYNDWGQLWYHLSGDPYFNESGFESAIDRLSVGIPYSELEALISASVTDQRVWGPVIFTDGFDFGSTEAWSNTVP